MGCGETRRGNMRSGCEGREVVGVEGPERGKVTGGARSVPPPA